MKWTALVLVVLGLLLPTSAAAWPVWGNNEIADCTFAAAANWEIAELHYTPSESDVVRQFHEAGGIDARGIDTGSWEEWWLERGIGGIHVRLHYLLGGEAAELRRYLDQYRYLLAALPGHRVLVVGYTTTGPLVVEYGETEQWTWHEWDEQVMEVQWASVVPSHNSRKWHPTPWTTEG